MDWMLGCDVLGRCTTGKIRPVAISAEMTTAATTHFDIEVVGGLLRLDEGLFLSVVRHREMSKPAHFSLTFRLTRSVSSFC